MYYPAQRQIRQMWRSRNAHHGHTSSPGTVGAMRGVWAQAINGSVCPRRRSGCSGPGVILQQALALVVPQRAFRTAQMDVPVLQSKRSSLSESPEAILVPQRISREHRARCCPRQTTSD